VSQLSLFAVPSVHADEYDLTRDAAEDDGGADPVDMFDYDPEG
jgi:hypothetical protein